VVWRGIAREQGADTREKMNGATWVAVTGLGARDLGRPWLQRQSTEATARPRHRRRELSETAVQLVAGSIQGSHDIDKTRSRRTGISIYRRGGELERRAPA
jgi:hypothetical protein